MRNVFQSRACVCVLCVCVRVCACVCVCVCVCVNPLEFHLCFCGLSIVQADSMSTNIAHPSTETPLVLANCAKLVISTETP